MDFAIGVDATPALVAHEKKHVAAFREAFNKLGLQDFDQRLLTKVERVIGKGRKKGWSDSRIRTEIRNVLYRKEVRANRDISKKAKKRNREIDKAEPHKKEFDGRGCDGRPVC